MKNVIDQFKYSHMPFLTEKEMLFCAANETESIYLDQITLGKKHQMIRSYMPWKIYCLSQDLVEIQTHMPEGTIECSPSYFVQDGVHYVTFVAGTWTSCLIRYFLYQMSGSSLTTLSKPTLIYDQPTRIGYRNSRFLVAQDENNSIIVQEGKEKYGLVFDCDMIVRTTYPSDDHNLLNITYYKDDIGSRSVLINLDTLECSEIKGEEKGSVYKCSYFEDKLIYALKKAGFEERALIEDKLNLVPFDVKITRKPVVELPPSPRLVVRKKFR